MLGLFCACSGAGRALRLPWDCSKLRMLPLLLDWLAPQGGTFQ